MEKIIKVSSKAETEQLLSDFSSSFQSLSSGQIGIELMADKLCTYGTVLKMENNNQIVAFAAFYCNDLAKKRAFLSLIAVKEEYRKMGYGRKMLSAVIIHSKNEGMLSLVLEVRKTNTAAISFYHNMGFSFTSRESGTNHFMELKLL